MLSLVYSFKYLVLLHLWYCAMNITETQLSSCGTDMVSQYIITRVFFSVFVQYLLASSCRVFLRVLLIPIKCSNFRENLNKLAEVLKDTNQRISSYRFWVLSYWHGHVAPPGESQCIKCSDLSCQNNQRHQFFAKNVRSSS